MARTTKARLVALTSRIHEASVKLGLLEDGWETELETGSKLNGRAYRLFALKPDGSYAHHNHPAFRGSMGYLGMTSGEADLTLSTIAEVLWNIVDHQRREGAK